MWQLVKSLVQEIEAQMAGMQRIIDVQQQLQHWWQAGVMDIPQELAADILAQCRDSLNSSNESNYDQTRQSETAVSTPSQHHATEIRPVASLSPSLSLGGALDSAKPEQTIANSTNAGRPLSSTDLLQTHALPEKTPEFQDQTSQARVQQTSTTPNLSDVDRTLQIDVDQPYPPKLSAAQRSERLATLQATVAACTRCPELCRRRTQTVFGVGNIEPQVCFLGEAPGSEEDRLGLPFVGPAGQLLDRILEASKLSRDQVYILNVAKCRPPNNRQPTDEEINQCWGYAAQQLEILQPEYIVCLGATAVRGLLRVKYSIPKLREKFHRYRDSKVMVTYHPSYLLRTPDAKKMVWADMKLLMRHMGVEL